MVILTKATFDTFQAQILSHKDTGNRVLYSASSTSGDLAAAQAVVRKHFTDAAAETVRPVESPEEIAALCGTKAKGRKVWTFDVKAKGKSPLAQAAETAKAKRAKAIDGKAEIVAAEDLPSLSAGITFAQTEIDEIGRRAIREALPLRLRQGLYCLKAQALFAISDPSKRGSLGGRPKTSSESDEVSEETSETPASFSDWVLTQPITKGSAYDYMKAVEGLGLDHKADEKQLKKAYEAAAKKAGDDLTITKLKRLAEPPPADEEEEDEDNPEVRAADAREHAHVWIQSWDKGVKAGFLEYADVATLRQLDEFLTTTRDHIRRRLKSSTKA